MQTFHDRPLTSIEPHDDLRRVAIASASAQNDGRSSGYRSRPVSPDQESLGKRRRIDAPSAVHQVQLRSPMDPAQYNPVQQHNRPNGVIDLTMQSSPPRPDRGSPYGYAYPSPRVEYRPVHQGPSGSHVVNEALLASYPGSQNTRRHTNEPYDPRQPMLPSFDRNQSRASSVSQREPDPRLGFVDAQVAPIQYVPHTQRADRYAGAQYVRPAGYETHAPNNSYGQPQPRVVYLDAPRVAPMPVHGAPAAVQQVPRGAPNASHPQLPSASVAQGPVPPSHMPVAEGYQPQPEPQYYYPR